MGKINNEIWEQVYRETFGEGFKTAVKDGRIKSEERIWLRNCEHMVKRALTIRNSQEDILLIEFYPH